MAERGGCIVTRSACIQHVSSVHPVSCVSSVQKGITHTQCSLASVASHVNQTPRHINQPDILWWADAAICVPAWWTCHFLSRPWLAFSIRSAEEEETPGADSSSSVTRLTLTLLHLNHLPISPAINIVLILIFTIFFFLPGTPDHNYVLQIFRPCVFVRMWILYSPST